MHTMEPDADLLAVATFMQTTVPQSKIVRIADALPGLARLLWSPDIAPDDKMLRLRAPPINHAGQSDGDPPIP